MDLGHIRRAARRSLRESPASPWFITFLFILCLQTVNVIFDLSDYAATRNLGSGLSAIGQQNTVNTVFVLLSYVVLFATSVWSANYQNFALNLSRGKETSFADLTAPFRIVGTVLVLNLMISIFTALWSFLLVIPGIIAAYRYRFAFLILFDNETMTAREALNASKRMTVGYKSDLFRLDLSFIWYYVLLALPSIASSLALQGYFTIPDRLAVPIYLAETLYLSVIQILFMPYVATATAHLYNQVLAEQQGPAPEQDPRLSGEF